MGMEILRRDMACQQANDRTVADRKPRLRLILRYVKTSDALQGFGQAHLHAGNGDSVLSLITI